MASIMSPTSIPRAPKLTPQQHNDKLEMNLDERDRTAQLMQRLQNGPPATQAAQAGQTLFGEPGGGYGSGSGGGYGGGPRTRRSQGGGGGPTYGFAPTNFSDGSRYNAEGYRADGRKKIQGFSADAAGLPDFGGLDQFYAQQDRSVPAFYNGSENSTGQSAPEVAGRVQAKGNMLVPVGDQGLSMVEPRTTMPLRDSGGSVKEGQPYAVARPGEVRLNEDGSVSPQPLGVHVPTQDGYVLTPEQQRGTPGYLQIARGIDQYAVNPFVAGMQDLGKIGYSMAEQTRDNMATLGNAVGTTAGFLREQPLKQGMKGLDWFVNGPQMVPTPAPVSKAGAPEMQRIGQQVDQWMQNAPPPTVAAAPPPSFMPTLSGLPAPAPMLAPAAPLPPMQIGAPAMSGMTAPEMMPAPGWAAAGLPGAGPQTGQVAQFMGPDPTVQYSSAPPTRSAGAMPTRLPPELAQAPALMPGLSYYQTRLAQRNFSRSPAGVQFFLNQQDYDRRNPQPAAPTAAAAPGMVPEGFMAVPKTFLPNGQVQSWGLQPKPEAPADVTPKLVPLPGTGYGMVYAGDRPMNTVPMQQPTESPSRIQQFLLTQVARAEKPETLRQLMNSTEDMQVIEAAQKRLDKLAPKDRSETIFRVDPTNFNKLEKETWETGKKLPPGGWQRMEDENNDGVPDAMQPQQPQGPATKTALDRYFSVRQ